MKWWQYCYITLSKTYKVNHLNAKKSQKRQQLAAVLMPPLSQIPIKYQKKATHPLRT
ncbi:hypothetical protein [Vogesella sp.]|uniref:hypothetical protein n=1 Tax=Vogesella sp. TaxID=1904252 RepID=UPI003F672CEA